MKAFRGLSRKRLLAMRAAGHEVLDCYAALARGETNLLLDFLRGMGAFEADKPYPPESVLDRESYSAFYYHAHRAGEHGHFHTFLHAPGMSKHAQPIPPASPPPIPPMPYAHLVAIRVDEMGVARGLFTVNRWVTGESFYAAPDVCAMLGRFTIDHASPSWLVNRWITAMVRLFRPQIERLIVARDAVLTRRTRQNPTVDPLEVRDLEVLSETAISIDRQISAVDRALA